MVGSIKHDKLLCHERVVIPFRRTRSPDVAAVVARESFDARHPTSREWSKLPAAIAFVAAFTVADRANADVGFEAGIVVLWVVAHEPAVNAAGRSVVTVAVHGVPHACCGISRTRYS